MNFRIWQLIIIILQICRSLNNYQIKKLNYSGNYNFSSYTMSTSDVVCERTMLMPTWDE